MSAYEAEPDAYFRSRPGVGPDAALWLYERGMSVLGTDTSGTEVIAMPNPERTTHQVLLVERGVQLIEIMNLEGIARERVREFLFLAGSSAVSVGRSARLPLGSRDRLEAARRSAAGRLTSSIMAGAGCTTGLVKGRPATRVRPRLRRPLTTPPRGGPKRPNPSNPGPRATNLLLRAPTETAGDPLSATAPHQGWDWIMGTPCRRGVMGEHVAR